MNNFEKEIKQKNDEELIVILTRSQEYHPEFIELVKSELREVRNIETYKDFFSGKSDTELINYIKSKKYNSGFVELAMKELTENRLLNVSHDILASVQEAYNEQCIRQKGKISGWLTLFLISIGLGGILTPILFFISLSISDYDTGMGLLWSQFGLAGDTILSLGFAVLAVYTIISFYNYKPNAVGLGKAYLILAFATNLISLIGGDYEATGFNSLQRIILGLFWQVVWFVYLCKSKQVNSLFPKEERKLLKRDKIALFTIVVPSLIWLLFVYVFAFNEGLKQQPYIIDESALSINEYTDGLIAFECPDGLSVEKQEGSNGTIYFLLNDDNEDISVTMRSAWSDNDTKEYFEEIMQNWADDSLKEFPNRVVNNLHNEMNGNSIYLKTLRYISFPMVEWTFVLIFNKETGKCCLISYYNSSAVETNHLQELIRSIRFK